MSEDVRELNEEELEQAAGGAVGGRIRMFFYVYECNDCKGTFSKDDYTQACPYCQSPNISVIRIDGIPYGDTREDVCEHFADADFAAGRCADIDGWD